MIILTASEQCGSSLNAIERKDPFPFEKKEENS
jgi:hypothetical protein